MSLTPDLSVIIVSYQSRGFIGNCLASLGEAARSATYEVVVADNASTDGSAEYLRREWPNVRVIETGANRGFAGAANLAIRASSGRHVLLLNPDAVALGGALDVLVDFLDATPNAGVVSPRLLNTDLTDQGTARAFPTPFAGIFGRRSLLTRLFPRNRWSRRYLVGRDRTGDEPFEVDWVSGACLMSRRDLIDRVDGLDEGFFMHWEDADLCKRIKNAGYSVHCVPKARVVHHEGGSRRGWPARQVWVFHQSAYRYYAKHNAPGAWSPRRLAALAILSGRAAAIIAAGAVGVRDSRDRRLRSRAAAR